MTVLLFACASPATVTPAKPDAVGADRSAEETRGNAARKTFFAMLPVDPDRALGDPKAKLAIVEFGDYQCPYCRVFQAGTFQQLQSAYIDTGKVRYFHKNFPLRMHAHAFDASIAAYCAGEQGHFWEMHDLLYAKQARLGEALYIELIKTLELDATKFDTCRKSRSAQVAVRRDMEEGRIIGISGTPTFVIGHVDGNRVAMERVATGAPAFETFAAELEALGR
jgi:protein-disulfide isomerase